MATFTVRYYATNDDDSIDVRETDFVNDDGDRARKSARSFVRASIRNGRFVNVDGIAAAIIDESGATLTSYRVNDDGTHALVTSSRRKTERVSRVVDTIDAE